LNSTPHIHADLEYLIVLLYNLLMYEELSNISDNN
jgi:hypothetical protein